MGSGMSMFNIFDNGISCGPFVYGRGKMQKIHSVSTIDGPEDGGRISDSDGYLWVQSPSFRDYCLVHCHSGGSSIKNINAVKKDGKKEEKATHSEEAVLVCTDEVCTMRASRTDPTSVNNERRERRFRNVLSHRPGGGMRNILKVHGHGKVPAGKIVRASD